MKARRSTSQQNLVFLKREKTVLPPIKIVKTARTPARAKSHVEWYEDQRVQPEHHAGYLNKLSQLRTELLSHEQDSLRDALQRLRQQSVGRRDAATRRPAAAQAPEPNKDAFPERHTKMQLQRKTEIERRRRVKSPPSLRLIQGEKLIDSAGCEGSVDATTNQGSVSGEPRKLPHMTSLGDINDVIRSQRARISHSMPVVHSGFKHTSSIPNIGRKAPQQPDKLVPLDPFQLKRTGSFIRQMSLHNKDDKGLYKGQRRDGFLLRGDTDELDLCPDSFKFDAAVPNGNHESKHILFPSATPVSWDSTNSDMYKLPRHAPEGTAEKDTAPGPGSIPSGMDVASFLRLQDNNNGFGLRSGKKIGYLNQRPVKYLSRKNAVQHKNHIHMAITGNSAHRTMTSESCDSCVMCQHPHLQAIKMDDGRYILVNRSTTDPFDRKTTTSPDTSYIYGDGTESGDETNSHHPTRSSIATDYPNSGTVSGANPSSSPRKQLIVEMPDLVLHAPTPVQQTDADTCDQNGVCLRKTQRQNELRQREMSNLLEDVKELNQWTEELEQKVKLVD